MKMKELTINEVKNIGGGVCYCDCTCRNNYNGSGCGAYAKKTNVGCAESITECIDVCQKFYKTMLCDFTCKPLNCTKV